MIPFKKLSPLLPQPRDIELDRIWRDRLVEAKDLGNQPLLAHEAAGM